MNFKKYYLLKKVLKRKQILTRFLRHYSFFLILTIFIFLYFDIIIATLSFLCLQPKITGVDPCFNTRQKLFVSPFLLLKFKGKGQNVESKKKNIESQKEHQKSERRKSNLSDFQILMKCQLPMA